MYNHNKAQQSKNRVHISWDILYIESSDIILCWLFEHVIIFSVCLSHKLSIYETYCHNLWWTDFCRYTNNNIKHSGGPLLESNITIERCFDATKAQRNQSLINLSHHDVHLYVLVSCVKVNLTTVHVRYLLIPTQWHEYQRISKLKSMLACKNVQTWLPMVWLQTAS